MSVSTSNILLYAADPTDLKIAMGVAGTYGIPLGNVIGDWETIWNDLYSGNYLVIAVGGPSNSALYYNPCGWPTYDGFTPSSSAATPFAYDAEPASSIPPAKYYENGAGTSALGTAKLVAMLAGYAANGSYPSSYGSTLPSEESASSTSCPTRMSQNVPCAC